MTLALTLRKRLLFLFCIFLVSFFMVSVLSGVIMFKFGATTPSVRIVTVIQDVLLFVLPPVVTALIVTRRPASLLCIDRLPSWIVALFAVLALLFSIPAMNLIIELNENLPLPESLASALREMERNAAATVELMTGPHDVPNLIVAILIVGVLAGVSEELLFRGGLQRLLITGGVNPHCAIWTTAFIFSLLHLQFYGFVPRMLLGALFGYALWASRSLWLPILLHVLNNSMYVINEWLYGDSSAIDNLGKNQDYLLVVASVVLTAVTLWLMFKARLSISERSTAE